MRFTPTDPPRVFEAGGRGVRISDCGRIHLEPNEQVTFVTESGAEYDLARKSWGFYATPSLNGRLQGFGLRAVLVKNSTGKYYIWLVERGKEPEFGRHLMSESHRVVCWMDCSEELELLDRNAEGGGARLP